jgi:hypothetical protein
LEFCCFDKLSSSLAAGILAQIGFQDPLGLSEPQVLENPISHTRCPWVLRVYACSQGPTGGAGAVCAILPTLEGTGAGVGKLRVTLKGVWQFLALSSGLSCLFVELFFYWKICNLSYSLKTFVNMMYEDL